MAFFTVTNLLDSGAGSFRQAILDSNSQTGADEIRFANSLSGGTINLSSGALNIRDSLSIQGLGADLLKIDAGGNSRVFYVFDENVGSAFDVSIDGLSITGGNSFVDPNPNSIPGVGGGLSNDENLTISNSYIYNNTSGQAGGIFTTFNGNLTLVNTTVANNNATTSAGGGIYSSGPLTLFNSTISGNDSASYGGGIATSSFFPTTITNSTITGNITSDNDPFSSGGIGAAPFSPLVVNNSIIAGNTGFYADVLGNFTSNGYNIIGDLTGSTGLSGDLVEPDINNILNSVLQNNGGTTPTHALISGSSAIDAGNNVDVPAGITTDQRGVGFNRIVNGTVDIGAFEVQPNTPPRVSEPSSLVAIVAVSMIAISWRKWSK